MKLIPIMLGLVASAAALAQIKPQQPAAPLDGKTLFREKCAMCHGPMGMGTGLLKRRVQPAMLEQRTDLVPDYVIAAARTGIGNMPAIPRGEVSDKQLAAIAAYLSTRKAPAQ